MLVGTRGLAVREVAAQSIELHYHLVRFHSMPSGHYNYIVVSV